MIPSYMISKRDEVAHKIAELKMFLEQKNVVEYQAYLLQPEADKRKAMDKVISELKMLPENSDWLQKEVEYEELRKTYSTMSFVLETLQKMISTVSTEVITVEQYYQYVSRYEEFFKDM